MAGVLLALLAARVLGLHAWSVELVTTPALVAGQALRLGQQSVQVPVSALRLHDPLDEGRAAITQAEESVRHNPRRRGGARTSIRPTALIALEHAAFQVRGIARTVAELPASDPDAGARLSPRVGELLGAAGAAFRAAGAEPGSTALPEDGAARARPYPAVSLAACWASTLTPGPIVEVSVTVFT